MTEWRRIEIIQLMNVALISVIRASVAKDQYFPRTLESKTKFDRDECLFGKQSRVIRIVQRRWKRLPEDVLRDVQPHEMTGTRRTFERSRLAEIVYRCFVSRLL